MKRKRIVSLILSIFLSIFIIIGLSFQLYENLNLVLKHPFISTGIFILSNIILFLLINFLFTKLDKSVEKQEKKYKIKTKLLQKFYDHPFIFSLIIIILGWSIYIIAFYPSLLAPDPSNQILQFFGIDNYYSHVSILLDESQIITNHHPVLHTLLLGSCVWIGESLGSVNFGLFIFTIIQTLILASTLSYTIHFMKSIGIKRKYMLASLIIYTLVPVFPMYAIVPVKDVIFGSFIILYIIEIYKYIKGLSKYSVIKTLVLLILIILFRNNGFHIIILSLPLLLLLKNDNRLKLTLTLALTLVFYFSYNNIILPYFKVTPSSPREKLSIPFQQTARYVKYYSDDLTESEKEIIDKILTFDTLAERYDPELSDPVKDEFNMYATDEDLQKYFKVWFDCLKRHPIVYIEATLENTYGYYYPPKTNWYIYSKYKKTLRNNGFDYHFNNLKGLRKHLLNYGKVFPYIPVIGLLVNIGFSTWLLLFMISYLIYKKKYKEIIAFIPSVVVLLVCIASPVNTYFRYALPNVFANLILVAIFINIIKKKEVKNEK